jgi:hypothetical protein
MVNLLATCRSNKIINEYGMQLRSLLKAIFSGNAEEM